MPVGKKEKKPTKQRIPVQETLGMNMSEKMKTDMKIAEDCVGKKW